MHTTKEPDLRQRSFIFSACWNAAFDEADKRWKQQHGGYQDLDRLPWVFAETAIILIEDYGFELTEDTAHYEQKKADTLVKLAGATTR